MTGVSMAAMLGRAARFEGRLTGRGLQAGAEIRRRFEANYDGTLRSIRQLFENPKTMPDAVKVGVALFKEYGLTPIEIIKSLLPLKESVPEENQIDYIACLAKEATADLPIDEKGSVLREATAKLPPTKKGKVISEVTAKFSLPDMAIVIECVISGQSPDEKGKILREATAKLALPDKIIVIRSVISNLPFVEHYIVYTRALVNISREDTILFEGIQYDYPSQTALTRKFIAELPPEERGTYIRGLIANVNNNVGKAQVLKDAIAWLSPANRGGVLKNLTDSPSIPDDELIMYIREAAADLDRDGRAILIREATLKRRPDVKGKAISEAVHSLDCGYVLSIVTADICLTDKAIAIKAATDKLSCIRVKRIVISAPELKAIIIRGALANLSSADREAVLQKVTDGLSQEEKTAIDEKMAVEKVLDELFQPSN